MRKLALRLLVLALVLTACAGPASQVTEPVDLPVTGTEALPEATAVITAEPEMAITQAPDAVTETTAPQAGSAMSGVVTYVLSPEESSVTYEVDETFINQGNVLNTAVGTTQGVTGEIQVDFDQPQATSLGTLTVDVSGLRSDSGRRDNAIRGRFLQSEQYPVVTFTPTAIEGLPETIEPGVEYPLTLRGDLTIRDVTRPAVFDARVSLQGDTLTGQAVTDILMSDYGFGPIDILGMLKTEDQVKVTVDLVARPQ